MADAKVSFDDGAVYERFMGRWSRAVGSIFLDWVAPQHAARWLDVGCGTGVFTRLVLDQCAPASVVSVDPAPAQLEHARKQRSGERVEFRLADAQSLPFPDDAFDVVASALVINFIADRPRALAEMYRVCRSGGVVAGYVWDLASGRNSMWPLMNGMRRIGLAPPAVPGTEDTSLEALASLFKKAGYDDIAVRSIDVELAFPSFEDFWLSQVPSFTPHGKVVQALSEADRARLMEEVRIVLPVTPGGTISYSARANAIKARVGS